MELYTINLHFEKNITLTCSDYYATDNEAIERAKEIATTFVTPTPVFYYMERNGIIWTDNPEMTKGAICYNHINPKPRIENLCKISTK